jgi:hypothetical protein
MDGGERADVADFGNDVSRTTDRSRANVSAAVAVADAIDFRLEKFVASVDDHAPGAEGQNEGDQKDLLHVESLAGRMVASAQQFGTLQSVTYIPVTL